MGSGSGGGGGRVLRRKWRQLYLNKIFSQNYLGGKKKEKELGEEK